MFYMQEFCISYWFWKSRIGEWQSKSIFVPKTENVVGTRLLLNINIRVAMEILASSATRVNELYPIKKPIK